MITKYVQMDFTDPTIRAVEAILDIEEAVKSASINLRHRYNIHLQLPRIYDNKVVMKIEIPEKIAETFSIGPHLKGIASYLLKKCDGRYYRYETYQRLLVYTEIAEPGSSNSVLPMVYKLEAIEQFAKLLQRSDEAAMDSINRVLTILKED